MLCDQVQIDLDAYFTSSLPPDAEAAIDSHLASCQGCAEEAATMREIGHNLSSGLKHWVDQGVCPPELMAQLEASICGARRQPWWQRWPTYAGIAGVAAVFLVALLSVRLNFTVGQVASLPFVGSLAAQLLYPDAEAPADLPDATVVKVDGSDEQNGVKLTVDQIATNMYTMRVRYLLRGGQVDARAIQPELTATNRSVPFRGLTTRTDGDVVAVTADFDPVSPGQPITLTVGGTLHVTFHN
jgi:anti-sigma factor RsiW